jgi:ABC-type transporter Mla subunit MlaD
MAIVLAIAVMVGYRFISRATGTSGGYMVYAYLPDVTGVAPQSRVMISGIQVGVVDRIWLDQGRARVDIKMNPEVPLFDDAAIGKRATSLIGEYYVVLIPGHAGPTAASPTAARSPPARRADAPVPPGADRRHLEGREGASPTASRTPSADKGQDRSRRS